MTDSVTASSLCILAHALSLSCQRRAILSCVGLAVRTECKMDQKSCSTSQGYGEHTCNTCARFQQQQQQPVRVLLDCNSALVACRMSYPEPSTRVTSAVAHRQAAHLCFKMLVAHCTNLSLCCDVQRKTFLNPSMSVSASSMSLHRHMCQWGTEGWTYLGGPGGGVFGERVGPGEGEGSSDNISTHCHAGIHKLLHLCRRPTNFCLNLYSRPCRGSNLMQIAIMLGTNIFAQKPSDSMSGFDHQQFQQADLPAFDMYAGGQL